MSKDQLKKLNSGAYKYANPYSAEKPKPVENEKPVPNSESFEKNAYLHGRIADMQKQIDSHKFDIVTLLRVISNEMDEDVMLDIRDIRKLYSDFRAARWHVLNRIEDKLELMNNFKLNLND